MQPYMSLTVHFIKMQFLRKHFDSFFLSEFEGVLCHCQGNEHFLRYIYIRKKKNSFPKRKIGPLEVSRKLAEKLHFY